MGCCTAPHPLTLCLSRLFNHTHTQGCNYPTVLQASRALKFKKQALTESEQALLGAQIAAGLACAAQHGVVHGALTLRHCKLSSRNHVKLSGFDLFFNYCDNELFEEARQHKELPIKV